MQICLKCSRNSFTWKNIFQNSPKVSGTFERKYRSKTVIAQWKWKKVIWLKSVNFLITNIFINTT